MTEHSKPKFATRFIYVPNLEENNQQFVHEIPITFEWFSGFAPSQVQKSIASFHQQAKTELKSKLGDSIEILEVSTKSTNPLGNCLSAFNLKLDTNINGEDMPISVECIYQSSKIFKHNGPFKDILTKSSYEAKTDKRLKESGELSNFEFNGEIWELEPKMAFYNYLYIKALQQNSHLKEKILNCSAFTDIAFNPKKSISCQAYALALFISLEKKDLLEDAMNNKHDFLTIMNHSTSNRMIKNSHETTHQNSFF